MSKIQKNSHGLKSWELQDKNANVKLEVTRSASSGRIDGLNIGTASDSTRSGGAWLSVEEAQSLRRWLNETLDTTA